MKCLLSMLAVVGGLLPAAAQTAPAPAFTLSCQDSSTWANSHSGGKQRFCETRDLTMTITAGQPLTIDGATNGGIVVHGWASPAVCVRAKITSWASSVAAARAQASGIVLHTTANTLRAAAPEADKSWAVSYEVFVPRQMALVLTTTNGGIELANLQADIHFHAVNGGVSLVGLGGQVSGETVNGGLRITLTGPRWEGAGLDVATTNGGIKWQLPPTYSAQLVTSTDRGSLRTTLPRTAADNSRRAVSARLGEGGTTVKAVTANGSVVVEQ